MNCIRCEVARAKIVSRLLLGLGFGGRHIAAKLTRDLPGRYYVTYEVCTGIITREAQKGGQAFEIVRFDRPIDKA